MTLFGRRMALSFVAALSGSPLAWAGPADWSYSVLTPAGRSHATLYGIGGGVAVGWQGAPTAPRATIWTSLDPSGAVDLTPIGATQSNIIDTTGSQHVGNVVIGGVRRAGLWNGSSFTSLHPSGYDVTYAQGTDGIHQTGLGTTTAGEDRALLWSGSAASAVVLNPAGSVGAAAYATGGGRQVGWAEFAPSFTLPVAGYWSGSAASWTRLGTPPQYRTRDSVAVAISPTGETQAGYITGDSGFNWATLWRGTPDSFTLLNPAGYTATSILATDDRYQVGWGITPGGPRIAAVWEGSAGSLMNLSAVLPPKYTFAMAYGVESTATDVWVVGYAYSASTDTSDAIVWHRTIPSPGAGVALMGMMVCIARRRR